MAKEIERKFLVAGDKWRNAVTKSIHLKQAYIASMGDRSVRIRTSNTDSAVLTIKIGQALVRDEFEYAIPIGDAEEMIRLAVGRVIEKTRHHVRFGGFLWEIDVFEGALSGLVIAEVELAAESDDPALPDWVGAEVTGDRRYSNQALATEEFAPGVPDGLPY